MRRRHAAPPKARPSTWFERPRLVLILLLSICSAVRLTYLVQVRETPFAEMHQWAESDMNYYYDWSQTIAKGDWLSQRVVVPQAQWHTEVVAHHVRSTPGALERLKLAQRPEGVTPASYVWNQWMHVPQFYQDGLYPYLLAVTTVVLGNDVLWVFVWQLMLGVVSTLLIWDLTRRAFGHAVGAVAGGLAALCGPLVYYELLLLRESTIVLASLLITWISTVAWTRQSLRLFLAAGGVVGLAALLKSSLLIFVPGVPAAMWLLHEGHRRRLLITIATFGVGVCAGLAPLVVRNIAVGVSPLALASSGPFTFVAANESTNQPGQGNYVNTQVLAGFLGASDGGWQAALESTFRGHTPISYLTLLGEKFYRAWHWYELPNNDNFYLRRLRVPVLQWLPITAWVISPLALLGLVLGLRRRREAWSLYFLVASALVPLMIFYVIGRFRVVLLAAAIPFAALAIVAIVNTLRTRQWRQLTMMTVGVAAVAFWTARPLDPGLHLIRTDDWLLPYSARYQPQIRDAGERGDFQTAAYACERSFSDAPSPAELATAQTDRDLPLALADIRMQCAGLWSRAGDQARAAAQAALAEALRDQHHLR